MSSRTMPVVSVRRRPQTRAIKRMLPSSLASSVRNVAREIVKTKKTVKRINQSVKQELRFIDTSLSTVNVTTTPTFILLNGMAPGDNNGNREGTSIMMKMLSLKFSMYAGDTAGNVFRVVIIYDKQPNGAQMPEADVFASVGDPTSLRFWNSRQRYTFVYDKTFALDINRPTQVKIVKRLNKPVKFGTGGTNGISDITKGSLYAFIISDSGATPNPNITGHARISYTP